MKLYLADNDKLNTFELPTKVSESFLFTYTPDSINTELYLNIYSKDEKWYIKSNEDIMINDTFDDVQLDYYKYYRIRIKNQEKQLFLYTYDNYSNEYKDVILDNLNTITIGSKVTDSISYESGITIQNQVLIFNENNNYYIQNSVDAQTNLYINRKIIKQKTLLNIGDVIFIDNLKIIWMNNFMRVFINDKLTIQFHQELTVRDEDKVDNQTYLDYNMKDNDESLYNEDDFFFRKPRLAMGYDEEEVKIDPPTKKESKEDVPLIFSLGTGMTMIVTSIITAYRAIINYNEGKTDKTNLIISIITASAMLLFSFLLPKLLANYNKRRLAERDKIREIKYNEYLEKKQSEINKILNKEKQSLFNNNPSAIECYNYLNDNKNRLFEREIKDSDFLTIRIGLGTIPSSLKVIAPEDKFTIDEDYLLDEARKIRTMSESLVNVPITMSLCNNFISSVTCNSDKAEEYINGLITQILYLHNPKDLKIVFLTNEKNAQKWDYIKLLPHTYSDDKINRYFATNEDEAKIVLKNLDEIYNNRKEDIKNATNDINEEIETTDYYKNFAPYYLIITDNYKKYKDLDFLNKLVNFNKNVGFSLLIIDNSLKNVPNECNKYAYVTDKESCLFEKENEISKQTNFMTEIFDGIDMFKVAKQLSSIPIQTIDEIYNFPSSISFLEMYNVGNIEQLNILNKWSNSNPIATLACPIGVTQTGELFKLDLHEKAHGPHGLIAGSTGSGKSEFIITYILSMAINYHPDEVQFVLIDYKGGGLAGAFENKETGIRIPHLSGTITNLDVSEMNRTLVSINSELKRRQKKFNDARDKLGESTIDIYKYQKYYRDGLLDEPIPHLFIISDEFAELKSQQPEFMDELISTARIGRSLGVHLILATQKPSGVVNDQIWSNSRFKVCLKVQTRQDSMEMLKRPEAASIKETGRFYLQVGYDELFELGQSAWTGAQYYPTEKVVKRVDDSISFIDHTGNVIKSANNINQKDINRESKGDQITNIVKYLYNLSIKNNLKKNKLWLDSIPEEIYLSNIIKKYSFKSKPYIIDAVIGELDDPESQRQGLYHIDITNTGNTLIYGIPGSGKENLLTTMITSICSNHTTDEVNIYILDFGAETLNKFKDFPQVGDIVYIDDKERINSLYTYLSKEINRRKSLFANYSGSYTNYIKNSGKKVPNIICFIHQYENMVDNLNNLSDKFINLFKEGSKFGINFVVTNSLATGIRIKALQLFPNKLSLKLNENSDYRYVLESPRNLIPANYFGRGIAKLEKTLEFQTAYISKPDEINNTINIIAQDLKKAKLKKAPRIPSMPDFLLVDQFINEKYDLTNIPIGISKNKLSICTYDFSVNYTPVITSDLKNNMHFVYALIELLKQIPNTKIRIIDVLKLYNNYQGIKIYNEDFDTIIKQIRIETLDDQKNDYNNIFIIIGLGAFKNNVPEKTQRTFNFVFEKIKEYKKNRFIIVDDYNSYKSLELEPWYVKNIDKSTGIWLGENGANQLSIKMPNLSLEERKIMFNQIGYIVKNSSHTIIRYVVDKEFDNEK